jgi:hypothetical protein
MKQLTKVQDVKILPVSLVRFVIIVRNFRGVQQVTLSVVKGKAIPVTGRGGP